MKNIIQKLIFSNFFILLIVVLTFSTSLALTTDSIDNITNENENKSLDQQNKNSLMQENSIETTNSIDDNHQSITKDSLESNSITTIDNPFYDIISENEMSLLKAKLNVENIKKSGIFVNNNSKETLLKFINGHSSYTYSYTSDNYLQCDKKLRKNDNLDIFEPTETEMDLTLNSTENDKLYILLLSSNYYNFEDNQISSINFTNSKYLKTYENNNTRIIILNNNVYNEDNNISYNLDLSDSFVKAISNVQYKVINGDLTMSKDNSLLRSSRSITAPSIGHQTVWGGPNDNGSYATIGSVDDGEKVYILGKEDDYYHVQYLVTSGQFSGKERSGYILRSNLDVSIADKLLIKEEVMTGGYRYANSNISVHSCDDTDISITTGSSLSNTEGVTLLYDYTYSDWTGKSYRIAFVEYSTSNGLKRGYVKNDNLVNPFSSSLIKSPAKVITYTGPDSSKFSVDTGAVGLNEYSCAIGYSGNYIFLEYNTTSGRRRAFAKAEDLNVSISSLSISSLPEIKYNVTYSSSLKQDVSSGPGACYTLCAYRGAVGKNEVVYKPVSNNPVYEQLGFSFIVYHVGSAYKAGYVPTNTLTLNLNPTFPEMPTYDEANGEFQKTYIGQTGLGQPLYSYKIGTGNNKIYLCFNQHGWEDGGTGDGVELVLLAKEFMQIVNQNRNNTGTNSTSNTAPINEIDFVQLLEKWTIYVIPSINRDGITSGWTNYGPGRTDVSTAIDINRNWDTSIYKYHDKNEPRNYNGDERMATSSAKALATYLTSDEVKPTSNGKSILIDIHGWDNEIITWDSASQIMGSNYFVPQFSSSNFKGYSDNNAFRSRIKASTGADGYLMRWAVEKLGTTNSMLLELPLKSDKTIDHDFIVNNNYSTRLSTAILNMLKNEY